MLHGALGYVSAPPTRTATTHPATQPTPFQPGIWIDWNTPAVHVTTRVVLRDGPLEFLACFAGKEHESILRFEPPATQIYMALGLIGIEPGRPPTYDPNTGRFADATGDLLDLFAVWKDGDGPHRINALTWLRDVEYAREPLLRPWIFGGSRILPDHTLSADLTGVGVALVDFDDSLICYSRHYPSRYGALWAEAFTERIPPVNTEVRLVIEPADARPLCIRVDAHGIVWVNDRYCTRADLVDLLKLARRADAQRSHIIQLDRGVLWTDEQVLRRTLARACGSNLRIEFQRSTREDAGYFFVPSSPSRPSARLR